jgi:sugar lactone lactonase YvrE
MNGKIRSESVPKLADGRRFRITDGIKCSPQRDLWTSDGDSLFRLSSSSTVDLILGHTPTPETLSAPGHIQVGSDDRIYVSDRRTKVVHIFNKFGKLLGRCAPLSGDLTEISSVNHIAVSPNGHVFVSFFDFSSKILDFDENLKRIGQVTKNVDSIRSEWHFQPTGSLCWMVGYNDIFLVKGLRDEIRRISRRADGLWLESPDSAAVAPDGSLAVEARSQSGETSINIFSPTGQAISTFVTPFNNYITLLSYDGKYVFVRDKGSVCIFDIEGRAMGKVILPSQSSEEDWVGPFTAEDGKEIWFVSGNKLKLYRYTVPVIIR